MTSAFRMIVRAPGGPEAIEREEFELTAPGPGEIRVANHAIGLNFIDIYHRTGLYPRSWPSRLGQEGAGVVDAVGSGVDGFEPGDAVAYLAGADGAYSTHSIVPAERAFRLPPTVRAPEAAAILLKGLTVWALVERCARIEAGQTVLVLAAAGGVGSIAVQWLKAIGATVIAHSGNAEKADIARRLGADHSLHCGFDALAGEVRALTDGHGVEAVLDGVGKDSWDASLKSLARLGMLVSFGNASGAVPPVAPLALSAAGSVFLTRPTIFDHIAAPEHRALAQARLFEMVRSRNIVVGIGQDFQLADAAEAHRALEERRTRGSTILIPRTDPKHSFPLHRLSGELIGL